MIQQFIQTIAQTVQNADAIAIYGYQTSVLAVVPLWPLLVDLAITFIIFAIICYKQAGKRDDDEYDTL